MSNLGNFLSHIGGKVFNFASVSDRNLYCLSCEKTTSHQAITCIDAVNSQTENDKKSEQIMGLFLGILGEYMPAAPIVSGNPYACYECRRVRFEGGLASSIESKRLDALNIKYKG
jgi:hypothetical protein